MFFVLKTSIADNNIDIKILLFAKHFININQFYILVCLFLENKVSLFIISLTLNCIDP